VKSAPYPNLIREKPGGVEEGVTKLSVTGDQDKPERGTDPELGETSFEGKTVVIGLGNQYMRDDGIGLLVTRDLRRRDLGKDVLVYDYQALDLSLLWEFQGASRVIFVDAMKSGERPGTISRHTIAASKDPLIQLPSLHALQLYDMFDLASQAGLLSCPVIIIGVEPKDCDVGEGLTEELTVALPRVVDSVMKELGTREQEESHQQG
jgi:hydrogenase maturation protease